MKKNYRHFDPSSLCAVLFFAVLFVFSAKVAPAQDTVNSPLVTTTGPNVLGKGELQWNTQMEYYHLQHFWDAPYGHTTTHGIGLEGNLRWGIGHKAELMFDLNSVTNYGKQYDSSAMRNYGTLFTPSVGVRLELFEGRGWLPQVTFGTEVSLRKLSGYDFWFVQPTVGLQFRNRLGRHWLLDYSLGYGWNPMTSYFMEYGNPNFRYSLFARWLPTDRLMLGLGVENGADVLEARWQATPDLQLSLQGNLQVGYGWLEGTFSGDVRVGLHWMLK